MDANCCDRIARVLGGSGTRRGALGMLLGGLAAPLLAVADTRWAPARAAPHYGASQPLA